MAKKPEYKRGMEPFCTENDFLDEKGNVIYKKGDDFFAPPDSPVKAVGTTKDNSKYIYENIHGKLLQLSPNQHNLNGIMSLFDDYWPWALSRYSKWKMEEEINPTTKKIEKKWKATGKLDKEKLQQVLMMECGRMGVVDLHDKIMMSGSHAINGDLYIHHGDCVSMFGGKKKTHRPEKLGYIDDKIFVADNKGEKIPRNKEGDGTPPDPTYAEALDAWNELYNMIYTWNWKRDDLDPQLFLGFLLASGFAGALDWRSSAWVQGPAGSGKSLLAYFAEYFTGGPSGASFRSMEPTSAAIRRELSNTSILAILDEQQLDKSDNIQKLFDLARAGSSTDYLTITAPDGLSVAYYRMQSPFLFFGVQFPTLNEQNESRLILFNLKALRKDTEELDKSIFFDKVQELAVIVRYYIARNWHEFAGRDKEVRKFLKQKGLTERERDQIASLMTFAGWIPFEKKPRDIDLDAYFPDIDDAIQQHYSMPPWLACLTQLTSKTIMVEVPEGEYINKREYPVSKILSIINSTITNAVSEEQMKMHGHDDITDTDDAYHLCMHWAEAIERVGCKVVIRGGLRYLFIPNQNASLMQIYKGSVFAGATGKEPNWNNYIITCADAARTDHRGKRFRLRVAGAYSDGIGIPLSVILGKEDEDDG